MSSIVRLSVTLTVLLAVSGCAVPSLQQKTVLDSTIGRTETELVRSFGVPSRTFSVEGRTFLAYTQNESSYSPGTGWGGYGFGGGFGGYGGGFGGYGGGYGGFGGPFGGYGGGYGGGFGGGFPPTYYQSSCTTTFEVNNGRVAGWSLRGDGC